MAEGEGTYEAGVGRTISVRALIEETSADPNVKHLGGEIVSFDELLQAESLDRLADQSPGALAYLAFHPIADAAVAEYVAHGSLASDSGTRILVMFTPSADARWGAESGGTPSVPGLRIDSRIHPSYEMVNMLFQPKTTPLLPGIVFFKSFSDTGEAVYVSLSGLENSEKVTERVRLVFRIVTAAASTTEDKFAGAIAVSLKKNRLPYDRTGRTSLREWFVRGYQLIYDHRGDIEALLPMI